MSQETSSTPPLQGEQSTANVSPKVAQIPIKLVFQDKAYGHTVLPIQRDSTVWDKFTETFKGPCWQGQDSLGKYRADHDEFEDIQLIPENIEDMTWPEEVAVGSWRPISALKIYGSDAPENLKGIHAIVFDVGHGMPADEIRTRLSGIKALVHSAYRHSPDDPHLRVIIPLRTVISVDDWGPLMEHFQAKFDGRLGDIYRQTPFHWFPLPACPHDAVAHYTVMHLEGEVFDGLWGAAVARAACINRGGTRIPYFQPDVTSGTPAMENVAATASTTGNAEDDPMVEAQQVITKAKEAAKAASEESVQPTIQPPESVIHASSGGETISVSVVAPATPSPSSTLTPKETVEDLVNDYYFPASHVTDDPTIDHAELMDELESLAAEIKKPDDYLRIRDKYSEVSMRLNLRGLWAPAFRPRLTIPVLINDKRPAHTLILRDRIVIDCHWLHSKGYKIRVDERYWRPLFKIGTPFPFELAAEFSMRVLRNEYRAEGVLGLTPFLQLQTQTLLGVAVQAQIKAVEVHKYVDKKRIAPQKEIINLVVNRWCELDRRVLPHREKYLAHAKARALLEIAHHTKSEIAELGGMIQGVRALSERTVRDFMAKLDSRLAKTA